MRVAMAIGVALGLLAEASALACSCLAVRDEAGRAAMARSMADHYVALAQVEVVREFTPGRGRGEQLRVVRRLAGRLPAVIDLTRTHFPSSASCDVPLVRGSRHHLAFRRGADGRWSVSGLCEASELETPRFRAMLVQAMARRLRR